MSTLPPSRTPGAVPGSHAAVTTAVNMRRARRVGFATIVIREFSRIMRIWGQTLVPPVITATLYFIIFGSLIRGFVRDGSELLTTITNDAWYGRSSAAYQHWDQAAMRAIENGRYLARAANTGVSGFVDPYARVLEKSELFEQVVLV